MFFFFFCNIYILHTRREVGHCVRVFLQRRCELLCRTETPLVLVLLRGPWSHNRDDKRREVSAEPAGTDLTEVTAAPYSEHDQFSRGKDTLLKALQGEIIVAGANRLMLSKPTCRQNQSDLAGVTALAGLCVASRLPQNRSGILLPTARGERLSSPAWCSEHLVCSGTGSDESYVPPIRLGRVRWMPPVWGVCSGFPSARPERVAERTPGL